MNLYPMIIRTLGALALAGAVGSLLMLAATALSSGRAWLRENLEPGGTGPLAGAWAVAILAMASSLYLSEVVGFVPCELCWFQRIAMYPLVLVLGAGLVLREPGVWRFALPLSVVGLPISIYHVIIQLQPSLDIVSCEASAPCTSRYVAVFGFLSIPGMAGAAFLLITALLLTVGVVRGSAEG